MDFADAPSSLSDYSDYDYDSSEDEWRAAHPNRKPAHHSSAGPSRQASSQRPRDYAALDEETGAQGRHGLLDPNDPFGDPFADEQDTPVQEKPRMQCEWSRSFTSAGAHGL
jgi:hypothetical protein